MLRLETRRTGKHNRGLTDPPIRVEPVRNPTNQNTLPQSYKSANPRAPALQREDYLPSLSRISWALGSLQRGLSSSGKVGKLQRLEVMGPTGFLGILGSSELLEVLELLHRLQRKGEVSILRETCPECGGQAAACSLTASPGVTSPAQRRSSSVCGIWEHQCSATGNMEVVRVQALQPDTRLGSWFCLESGTGHYTPEPRFCMLYEAWRKQTRSVRDTTGVYLEWVRICGERPGAGTRSVVSLIHAGCTQVVPTSA